MLHPCSWQRLIKGSSSLIKKTTQKSWPQEDKWEYWHPWRMSSGVINGACLTFRQSNETEMNVWWFNTNIHFSHRVFICSTQPEQYCSIYKCPKMQVSLHASIRSCFNWCVTLPSSYLRMCWDIEILPLVESNLTFDWFNIGIQIPRNCSMQM